MKHSILIDNRAALLWGLTLQQAYLFDWMANLSTWAEKVILNGEVYYFASRNKAIEELPLLTDKPDTMYRYYKGLEETGVIKVTKIEGKEYVAFTQKAAAWGRGQSERSENFPSGSGLFSGNGSENFPTNNTTILDNTTNDKFPSPSDKSSGEGCPPNDADPNKKSGSNTKGLNSAPQSKGKASNSAKKDKSLSSSQNVEEEPESKIKGLYEEMMKIYDNWIREKTGAPAMIDGIQGKAMKKIIEYLQRVSRDRAKYLLEAEKIIWGDAEICQNTKDAWAMILLNFDRVDEFMQDQIKLNQICSNLQNIINQIKNGSAKKKLRKPASEANQDSAVLKSDFEEIDRRFGG